MAITHKYTLVRHTGLPGAVELRAVSPAQARAVEAAGAPVFDGYAAASDAEEAENYPPGVEGLYPRPRGSFRRAPGFGEDVYVPAAES